MTTFIHELKLLCLRHFPGKEGMLPGILYYSEEFELTTHLCACGCGEETVLPIGPNDWQLVIDADALPTLNPSIGNWRGQSPYHAHYFIRGGKIDWCADSTCLTKAAT